MGSGRLSQLSGRIHQATRTLQRKAIISLRSRRLSACNQRIGPHRALLLTLELYVRQLLAEAPQSIGRVLIDCVRAHAAVSFVISGNQAGNIAIFAIHSSLAIQLRTHGAPNRGCRTCSMLTIGQITS
jgi:hypothetical protein